MGLPGCASRVSGSRVAVPLGGASVDRAERPEVIWRKSRRSATGDCVEIAFDGTSVLVRDSKEHLGAVLSISGAQWQVLRRSIKKRYG
ncbi:DUF397 domain-containing protein [Actinomadura sp. B10D3]|uniref:DUF397 domain-containing protein n=1 Tax=Actinomadura sp. B10D3 TaxID=3153557 RepID=UPI00325EC2EF